MKQKIFLFPLTIFCVFCTVRSQNDMKSDFVFVIDDTGSMADDIRGVKDNIKDIFNIVLKSNSSQIEDFVLYTYNDPCDFISYEKCPDVISGLDESAAKFLIRTRDPNGFRAVLDSIEVDGGGDCAELSMTGIERALETTRLGSYIYVFTDADAKDGTKYESVKRLALKKQCQIVFVLSDVCTYKNDEVYEKLATETNGQVFNLHKNEVSELLNYVKKSVDGRKTIIKEKNFPSGTHSMELNVDGDMKELIISVSGLNPDVKVTDPHGASVATEDIVRTSRIAVVKVPEVSPGLYTAQVTTDTSSRVVVSGSSSIHFRHGFSTMKPTSIEETSTRPISGEPSYLSIKLYKDQGNVELQSVQLLDLDDNVLAEQPLEIVREEDKFYVTVARFMPPDTIFKVAIKGFDEVSKTTITRMSMTPVEPQVVTAETVSKNKAPEVTALKSKIKAEYDDPLELKCKISAYPKPDVVWTDKSGRLWPSSTSLIDYPFDYISILKIERVNSNSTYTCRATNAYGENAQDIEVVTKRNRYFNVLEYPRDAVLEYNTHGRFVCKTLAFPTATVTWYLNGRTLKPGKNIEISPDGSILTIKHMRPKLKGSYACEAKNDDSKKIFRFKVGISGVEPPALNKTITEVRVAKGSNVVLNCSLLNGKPRPVLKWFFRPKNSEDSEEIGAGETLHIDNVSNENAGTYRCGAHNVVANDNYYTDLIVESGPTIKEDVASLTVVNGERVKIPCDVGGEPAPRVRWLVNGVEIRNSRKHQINIYSYSLSFQATLDDIGIYVCEAKNEFGSAVKATNLNVVAPPTLEIPSNTTLEVNVGGFLTLPCRADGYPVPQVHWTFIGNSTAELPLTKYDGVSVLRLTRIQRDKQGLYRCVASNAGGSTNITFQVIVHYPPVISKSAKKEYTAVLGDLVLRVPCRATGNPEPAITWVKDGTDNIGSGTEWYDIERDGTLIIKNLDKSSAGWYVCYARNRIGFDNETYEVLVKSFPDLGPVSSTIPVLEGNSTVVDCTVPHTKVDQLKWFKDEKLIATGELELKNIQVSDAGVYSCRVSNFYEAKTGHVEVTVGYKPRFVSKEDSSIGYEEGAYAVMDCTADAEPMAQVSWWRDGAEINETDDVHVFEMKMDNRGTYYCLVQNDFGYIMRSFEISSKECILNIEEDFKRKQPIMTSVYFDWPTFSNEDGYVRIPTKKSITLTCPKQFQNFRATEIVATCQDNTNFDYAGNTFKFSDFQCNEEVKPVVKETNKTCSGDNTEVLKIGYEIKDNILGVYDICYDKAKNVPLFAKQIIRHSSADAELGSPRWFNHKLAPFDFNTLYDCKLQINTIYSLLGRWFHSDDKCCFSKKQLVNPRDVAVGLAQSATYSNLNVVPLWSTCNSRNWDKVERKVRKLAKSSDSLTVWTGTSGQLKLKGTSSNPDIYLSDMFSKQQAVPEFIWKVVQDQISKASLAIIHVNVPDLTFAQAYSYMRCTDICYKVKWIRSSSWRDVTNGYTYCCSIKDFERAFGLDGVFDSREGKVLEEMFGALEVSLT